MNKLDGKAMNKLDRKAVQKETLECIKKSKSLQTFSTFRRFSHDMFPDQPVNTSKLNVEVVKGDTLEVTMRYQKDTGKRFCFLIMANAFHPGGGYLSGATAQEESVCRRTNVSEAFKHIKYPLDEFGGIYGRNVVIFRDTEENDYSFLKTPVATDCIFVAAYNNPKTVGNRMTYSYERKTYKKIMSLLEECKIRGAKNLILGALGCGAFSNPPEHVAELFKKALSLERYKNYFENVVFAIYDNRYSNNYEVFKKILESS